MSDKFYCYLFRDEEPIWCRQALRQSGGQAERQELNRTEQPAIHMDQVDRLSINGLPLESKTPAQAREELLREIRIPAAIQVSLYVFAVTAPFPSPTHLQQERQKAFSEVIYTPVLYIEWRALLTALWNTIGFSVESDAYKGEMWFGWRDWLCVKTALAVGGRFHIICVAVHTVSLLSWKLSVPLSVTHYCQLEFSGS